MKLFKKILGVMLALILMLTSMTELTSAFAAEARKPKVTVLQNDFIKITVDNATGRFGIRTVEGQPIRKKDQNVNMLYAGDDPETSFTTFRIDGTDYIFGNPYKFAPGFFSEIIGPNKVNNTNGTKQIETIWKIKGVAIKQILMLYSDPSDKKNAGNVNIRYEVFNNSNAKVELGTRLMLDTMVGGNDGPEFQIGTAYKQPLMVERTLVHNPEDDPNISFEDRAYHKLPPYWVMRDKLDLTNPLATNVIAYGFNNFAENNINIVDRMIVGHWNGLASTKWDYTPNGNLDFTVDTNAYGSADSAVAFYWEPKPLAPQAVQSFETVYGLGEIIAPDKVFSIRYMDPVQQLATLEDNSNYANEGIFDITAEIENLEMFRMEHKYIEVEIALESGLSFVKVDELGNIVRDDNGKVVTETSRTFSKPINKTATPEEAANGTIPSFKPGDSITVSYKVQAKGKPWPTTKQYIISARSPQTLEKIGTTADEGIKAQYDSSKANFVLLPPIGQATPTYVYGMSPKEVYNTDVKYVTVNITNIDAYNTGSEDSEPNFDLFFKEKITGKRYKARVKDSVITQPTDDGFSGDMRITYRGGDLVNDKGEVIQAGLGPELPLGEYQVEIDYKGDTGGDPEIAAMYDVITSQSFLVTDNEASRIREANILAIYKQTVDLSHVTPSLSGKLLDDINEAFPGKPFKSGTDLYSAVTVYKMAKMFVGTASKLVDPKFDLTEFLDNQSLAETPAYNYELFESEDELEEFFEDEAREQLVVVRGMIKQVGTGDDQQLIVDTKTEPAIINESVAYRGKDMVFVRGKLDVFDSQRKVNGYDTMPFFDTLFVKGEGTLSVASSGFVFHKGEWTLDFYNGFDKTLGEGYLLPERSVTEKEDDDDDDKKDEGGNEEDDSLNKSISWAAGALGDRLNPLRQLMIPHVYFNRHSLFAPPTFMLSGFSFSFNEFILRPGGISFGGKISIKVVEAEISNVIFNDRGFVGVDAGLKFDLNEELGLIGPKDKKSAKKEDGPKKPSGEINIVHYVQPVEGVSNRYGFKFDAQLKNMLEIQAELSLKKVADGRILPDTIAFGTTLGKPGVLVTGATYLTAVRGAVRELADTIAGGTKNDPFPLVIQAGVSMRFGIPPAYHFGDIDLTLKRTGLALQGKLDFATVPDPTSKQLIPMLTKALLEAQWVTPWFVRLEAEVDIGGWDIIIGKAGIFVGQNLEKKRIDFEGYIGARVQIPNEVPVVGGMPLSSVFFGLNNDKIWGSIGILFISIGITYYWGGGVEFGTSDSELPEGFIHMLVEDPERGPRLLVIGQGIQTVATSWVDSEQENHGIVYHKVEEGVSVIDTGSMSVGIGGIKVKNGGRIHEIPMSGVISNALLEVEYTDKELPSFTLKDAAGKTYPIVFDNTNTNPSANAFTQFIPAADSKDQVDTRKAYIIIPQEQTKKGGTWTLTSLSPVETKLLNVPTTPQLTDINLTQNSNDSNQFTASWKVDHAKPGDKISLYLTKDAISGTNTTFVEGMEVLQPGEPGLLIAKDLSVGNNGGVTGNSTSGNVILDVTKISMLGDTEDIRGLLQQGDYYLRAELKSDAAFGTKTSAEKFEIIDPLAPQEVSEVSIEPAGNGLFALSFKPSPKKSGHENYEHSYVIDALREQNGGLSLYPNFGELMFTEEELTGYWNPSSGKYEGILVGGWTASSVSNDIDSNSLKGSVPAREDLNYTGLEVGHEYVLGVSAITKPTKDADKNENYHYAGRMDSVKKLLPVPKKPGLSNKDEGPFTPYMELLTNKTEQTIELYSDQKDMEVEAFYDGQSIGKAPFTNTGNGSKGSLNFNTFVTDGPYAIELRATNTKTKDVSVTMLYLTVDTIAPILYIDQPLTGTRTENGKLQVFGRTSDDSVLEVRQTIIKDGEKTVKKTPIAVSDNGSFNGQVEVVSDGPGAKLEFVARDHAGNENLASVEVTNDQFEAPSALVLKKLPVMKPGDVHAVEAFLRFPDGKDAQGKLKFKEIAVPAKDQSKVKYSIQSGDAVSLADGKVMATALGASLLRAQYEVSEGVLLETLMVASVDGMDSISAYTSSINGSTNRTRVVVSSAGDMTEQQLVYKVFAKGNGAVLPTYKQSLSDWSVLPANGEIAATQGDSVVIAKSTYTKSKQATGSISSAIVANVSAPAGPGGMFMPPVNTGLTVNQKPLNGENKDGVLTAHITSKDVPTAGTEDIVIASQDQSATGFALRIDRDAVRQAAGKGQSFRIEALGTSMAVTPAMLAGMDKDLEIKIGPNGNEAQQSFEQIAASTNASLLADGKGLSVETNIPETNWKSYMKVTIPIPDSIQADEITAVVLKSPNGEWTPLPWKMNTIGKQAYADVQLTGQGNIIFLRNTKGYDDVADGFWGKPGISAASAKLFVLGKGDGLFEPESNVTRAEYPTMLLRVAGVMNKHADLSFSDMDENDWYSRSVAIASQMGIVNGMSDGTYAPNAKLTRAEAMTMIGRLLEEIGLGETITDHEIDNLLHVFDDRDSVPDWARKPAALSIKYGIIQGVGNAVLPNDPLTRAQAAAIAVRLDQWITGQ